MKVRINPHTRHILRRDYPTILEIERSSFVDPWSEEDFTLALRQRNVMGRVAEVGDEVIGFIIYQLLKKRIVIMDIATRSDFRRCGVASVLIGGLKQRLHFARRSIIEVETYDSDLQSHLFFRAAGFRAVADDETGSFTHPGGFYLFQHDLYDEIGGDRAGRKSIEEMT